MSGTVWRAPEHCSGLGLPRKRPPCPSSTDLTSPVDMKTEAGIIDAWSAPKRIAPPSRLATA
jgi:hypothetical protein